MYVLHNHDAPQQSQSKILDRGLAGPRISCDLAVCSTCSVSIVYGCMYVCSYIIIMDVDVDSCDHLVNFPIPDHIAVKVTL